MTAQELRDSCYDAESCGICYRCQAADALDAKDRELVAMRQVADNWEANATAWAEDVRALTTRAETAERELETERIISASRLATRAIDVGVIEAFQRRFDEVTSELNTLRDAAMKARFEVVWGPLTLSKDAQIDDLRAQLTEARKDASELAHYLSAVLGPYPDPAHARIAALVNRVMDQG